MSGGAFEYKQYHIEQLIEDMELLKLKGKIIDLIENYTKSIVGQVEFNENIKRRKVYKFKKC